MASSSAAPVKEKQEIAEAQSFMRAMRLCQQGGIIPAEGFRQRKAYFLDEVPFFSLLMRLSNKQEQPIQPYFPILCLLAFGVMVVVRPLTACGVLGL
jgi:hypothetical protein